MIEFKTNEIILTPDDNELFIDFAEKFITGNGGTRRPKHDKIDINFYDHTVTINLSSSEGECTCSCCSCCDCCS